MRLHPSAILLASIVPCLAMAQGAPLSTLERGAKIRLTAATVPESEKVGRFQAVTTDTIEFRPDAHPVTRFVMLKDVRTLEVSRSTRTRSAEYATLGAAAGVLIGFISSNHNGTGIGTGKNDASDNAIVGGIAGLAIGGALGWWYGGKKKIDEWQIVDHR